MRLVQHVKDRIRNARIRRGSTVLIGVSGGPDSVALAHILHKIQYNLGIHCHICHYNHHLRRGANSDQKFVEQLARELNMPCSVGHWTNPLKSKGGSREDAARRQRFKFFSRCSKKTGAAAVLLAHTEDDQAETVLMRILRGAGLQGLRGIMSERTVDDLKIVRPLLEVSKADLLKYLDTNRQKYRQDPTNGKADFFRNKIRLELLPLLSDKYNANIKQILVNIAENASTDYHYLDRQTQRIYAKLAKPSRNGKVIRIPLKSYLNQHPAVQQMILRNSIRTLKGSTNRITRGHLKSVDNMIQNQPPKSVVHLPQKIRAQKNAKDLILSLN